MIYIRNKRNYNGDGFYIARPSILGNPFSHLKENTLAEFLVKNRREAIFRYEEWIEIQININSQIQQEINKLVNIYKEKGELNLICWCYPLDCHGYVLAKIIRKLAGESF